MISKIKKGVEVGQHIALCFTIMGAFGAYMVHQRIAYNNSPRYHDWN
jgi:hypothetical protein